MDEEVLLTCSTSGGGAAGVTYGSEPDELLLDIDSACGAAVFIPSAVDAGAEFPFTCRGTSAAGTGAPSAVRVIIPLAPYHDRDDPVLAYTLDRITKRK